ncbi:hypothetical protein TNCT_341251 [Trichonephila clavata]|uniref:Uncharacterized protein n=1 Tax=Trichonephila clavata TaxID=2740835 RepID=A0A8X6KA95_TRICU|nr:hypothetical protein TNCT_341251 [Trichonephila clavata]
MSLGMHMLEEDARNWPLSQKVLVWCLVEKFLQMGIRSGIIWEIVFTLEWLVGTSCVDDSHSGNCLNSWFYDRAWLKSVARRVCISEGTVEG